MRMDLDEEMADRLTSQAFAALGELPGRFRRANFAGQADRQTKLRVIVFHSRNAIMANTLLKPKGFEEGFGILLCGGWNTPVMHPVLRHRRVRDGLKTA